MWPQYLNSKSKKSKRRLVLRRPHRSPSCIHRKTVSGLSRKVLDGLGRTAFRAWGNHQTAEFQAERILEPASDLTLTATRAYGGTFSNAISTKDVWKIYLLSWDESIADLEISVSWGKRRNGPHSDFEHFMSLNKKMDTPKIVSINDWGWEKTRVLYLWGICEDMRKEMWAEPAIFFHLTTLPV